MAFFCYNGAEPATGLSHLWYISLAMQCYLVMPFVAIALQHIMKRGCKSLFPLLIVTMAAGFLLRYGFYGTGAAWHEMIYTNLFFNLDFIITGMLIATIRNGYRITGYRFQIKMAAAVFFFAALIYNCYLQCLGTSDTIYIYRVIILRCGLHRVSSSSWYPVINRVRMAIPTTVRKRYRAWLGNHIPFTSCRLSSSRL